jgi:hypothetical protein
MKQNFSTKWQLVLSIFVTCLLTVTAMAAYSETSYPLICRGGLGMTASAGYSLNDLAVEQIFLSFRKGLVARTPGPGECVWLDRGFRGSEPSQLWYSAPDNLTQTYAITSSGITASQGPLTYLIRAVALSQTFYVHAYRWNNYLVVTRLGP